MKVKKLRTISVVSLSILLVLTLGVATAIADSIGPKNPGTGTDTTGTGAGTIAWNNNGTTSTAGNITTPGTPYAVSNDVGSGQSTHYLTATNDNMGIPSDATITGIQVDINRSSSGSSAPLMRDNVVRLQVNGSLFGTNKAITGTDWPTTLTKQTYGGKNDLWGDTNPPTTLTPANINLANFGVVLSARNANTNPQRTRQATVDYMQVTVYYTVNTTTTVNCAPGSLLTGEPTTCTATVTRVSGSTQPSGTITWTSDGAGNFSATTCNLVGVGQTSASCHVDYTPTAGGTHKITASFPGVADKLGASSGNGDVVVTVPGPALALDKTADVASFTDVGTVIHYTYTLTNSGNVALSGPFTVEDDKGTVTCLNVNSLAPKATLTCTSSYTTVAGDVTAKSVVNTATAHAIYNSTPVNSASASVTVIFIANTTTSVDCTPNPLLFGGKTTCTATVASVSGDIQPSGTISWSSDGGGTFTAETCDLTGVDTNSASCQVDYTPGEVGTASHKITASFAGVENSLNPSSGSTDVAITVPGPSLALDKTADISSYNGAGTVISYAYLLRNDGNVALDGPFTVTDDKLTVTCPDTTSLAVDASLTCTASYTTVADDVTSKSVANTAIAHAAYGGTALDSDPDSVTVFYVANTTTAVECSPSALVFGEKTTCTATVTSEAGDVLPTGAITWSSDGSGDFSAPTCDLTGTGASASCQVDYTPSEVGTGSHKITASFPGVTNSLGESSGSADVAISVPGPALALDKTSDVTSFKDVGAAITYSYLLTNKGNVALTGPFTVTDDKVTVTCPDTATLATNATLTCAASYTTAAEDVTAKSVVNTATAHAAFGDIPVNSDPDSVIVYYITGTTTTVECSPIPVVLGTSTSCTATVVSASGDILPTGTISWSSDGAGTFSAITCDLPGSGTIASCSVNYTPTEVGTGTHKVTASFPGVVNSLGESSGSANVGITPAGPSLNLVKTADISSFTEVGTVIHYTYTLTNNGNIALSGPFTVTDNKVTVTCPDTATLASNATLTCTASYTTVEGDVTAKSIVNTASAHAKNGDTTIDSNEVSFTVKYGIQLFLPEIHR
jgi:hypothetical protein